MNTSFNTWIKKSEAAGSFKEKDKRTEKENETLKMENNILKQGALILGRKEM